MKLIVLCKTVFESLAAIMALPIVIKELGHDVEVITSRSEPQTKAAFAEKGINIIDLMPEFEPFPSTVLKKAHFWRTFAKRAWSQIGQKTEEAVLWISTGDTALALGKRLLRRHYVLQIRELYDKYPLYRRMLAKYARGASCVVVPQICRAGIFRSWYSLKQTPLVLPNKPANHPRRSNLEIEDERARDMLARLRGDEKIVLYQGGISPFRELRFVAEAVQTMDDGWRFAAMGTADKEYLENLRKSYPSLIYIPKVVAPYHLQITSHAYIGVVTYSYERLNNVFCAPNKTWEYAGFGLPMLCNDLPPLQLDVQANGAGLCVDIQDSRQIASALREIDDKYDSFSQAAQRLYDSIDTRNIMRSIMDRVSLHM